MTRPDPTPETRQSPSESGSRPALPRTVIGLGLVSLLTDVSSEAIFPFLPAFLATLGASNAFIGLIEGAAELVSNLLKYVTGRWVDRRRRLKPLVLVGYCVSTLARPLVALAAAPWHVLAVRVADRIGKGIRTTPRDALIAAVTPLSIRGKAYGFHRAMDHAGAALGTLLGAALLWSLGVHAAEAATGAQLRMVFLWAAVPGVLAVIVLALTREPAALPRKAGALPVGFALPPGLARALPPIVLFAVANATDAFLLVMAARLGAPSILAPFLWLGLHIVRASTSTAGGRLADRIGNRNALVLGWLFYAGSWGAIGFAGTIPALLVLSCLYGIANGLVEGPERALVAELAEEQGRGRAFGVYNMGVGFAALAGSTAFGAVLDRFGSVAAFGSSAIVAVIAAVLLVIRLPGGRRDGRLA